MCANHSSIKINDLPFISIIILPENPQTLIQQNFNTKIFYFDLA